MKSRMSRRSFLCQAAAAGTALVAGKIVAGPLGRPFATGTPDIAAVTGTNYYDATVKAVELLGGMQRFVSRGSRVGLLVNSVFDKPGSYVKPQIALAVITMCHEAGASQIISLEDAPRSYWRRAVLSNEHQEYVKALVEPGPHKRVALPAGVFLKEVEVTGSLLECDAYINVPIFKDHEGVRYTGSLKNIMGTTSSSSNRFFHGGSGIWGGYDDIQHLSQCIADANLLRKPTLCVGDATEVLIQNGPSGPGPVKAFHTVVAATDPVAFDTYGVTLLGLRQDELLTLRCAERHGLGTCDLGSLTIQKSSL